MFTLQFTHRASNYPIHRLLTVFWLDSNPNWTLLCGAFQRVHFECLGFVNLAKGFSPTSFYSLPGGEELFLRAFSYFVAMKTQCELVFMLISQFRNLSHRAQ